MQDEKVAATEPNAPSPANDTTQATAAPAMTEPAPVAAEAAKPEPAGPAPSTTKVATLGQQPVASDDAKARVTGHYFFHMRRRDPNPETHDVGLQDGLMEAFAKFSGVGLA